MNEYPYQGTITTAPTTAPEKSEAPPGPEQKALKPSVVNYTLPSADTQYKHKLPLGCKRLQMQMRDATDFRFSFEDGVVAKPHPGYFTVKSGTVMKMEGLNVEGDVFIYMACDSTSKVVEIMQWS